MTPTSSRNSGFELVRAQELPDLEGAYLDAASITPLPRRSRVAMDGLNELRGRPQHFRAEDFAEPVEQARRACALLIGASPAEIALGPNTSFGLNVAALGLRLPKDSIVLTSQREFPANVYPWAGREAYSLELVPVGSEGWPDEARILERLEDPRVAVLALSSVQFSTGYKADLAKLGEACRARDVIFVVDAIQSLGQIPLDVASTPVDIVAAGGHKWLCGPLGSGFLYVRDCVQERLEPQAIGWLSMQAAQALESIVSYRPGYLPDARAYEQGTQALPNLAGLAASIDLLREMEVSAIQDHLLSLGQPLLDWVSRQGEVTLASPNDMVYRSAIVALRTPSLESTHRALRAAGVICSIREGCIRLAPHFYNTINDIEAVIEVLDERAGAGWI